MFSAQSSAQNDTLYIKNLNITPDATVADIQGVTLHFSLDFAFDSALKKSGITPGIDALVQVYCDNKPVQAVSSTQQYKLNSGFVGCDMFPNENLTESVFLHIPYYAMDLSTGLHAITFGFSTEFLYPQAGSVQAVVAGDDLNQKIEVHVPKGIF